MLEMMEIFDNVFDSVCELHDLPWWEVAEGGLFETEVIPGISAFTGIPVTKLEAMDDFIQQASEMVLDL